MASTREEDRLKKAAERKHQRRLEMRRGYYRAARARERAIAEGGIADLPIEVAFRVEEALNTPAPEPEPVKVADVAKVEDLTERLIAIRERLFWLAAVWANTLSSDVYQEAERYRAVFRELDEQLRTQDPAKAEAIVAGHEALLFAEPEPPRPRLSLADQEWFELAGEVSNTRTVRAEKPKPNGYVPDGLQAFQ